ncbi:MAG TPA: 16S rRNA (cytosine(967)-C(5))-methyltransferase RsmB [Candidatus Eubacterium faecavium]|nr:16S rRNA (cytosine(967)-C(5))-methyltransferase RsmB [Candidatus Eubacterium faecavium]
MTEARQTAFDTLYKVFYGGAYSNIALDDALGNLSAGRAFASRLIYGVVERRLTLDYILSLYCKKPKPKLLVILRMGVYQLYFMDKVTSAAAVDESVKLAKANGMGYYASFVNAVLHKINDNRMDIDGIEDLSVRFSVPQYLINMWIKAYGREKVLSFLPSLNENPPVFAVANLYKTSAAELAKTLRSCGLSCEVHGGLVRMDSAPDLTSLEAFKKGLFHIQDISAYKAVSALKIKDGDTVVDFCAAPGGKSFTASYFAGGRGNVYSYDIYPQRVSLIEKGCERLGISNVSAFVNDASVSIEGVPRADKIICDVPCSGFGTVRRKPEIRYKELDSIKALPELQLKILNNASGCLKSGGRLLYSTCTLNKRENEKVADAFLEKHPDFEMTDRKTIFPGDDGGDGFFYCIFERN